MGGFFLQNYSQPPLREPKTHQANMRALKHLDDSFGSRPLATIGADDIELYLRTRLRQRVRAKTRAGFIELGQVKPTTVHQEFRVLRRMLNIAVRKRLLSANPCWGVEFPVRVKGLFRPHYVTWSEQQQIEFHAPGYLANAVRIITETGLRVYKELTPMRKDQLDLANKTLWIPDSKTPNGIAEVPLTDLAVEAFENQIPLAGDSGPLLFPSSGNPDRLRRRSRQLGGRHYAGPEFHIFGFTICVPHIPPGFLLAEWQTNGSRNCFGRAMPRCSRSIRR
jgi:integrase